MLAHVSTLAPGTLVCHLTIAYISTYICTYTAKGDAKYYNVNITYISTGGGATLEYIVNHDLPGLSYIGEK